MTNKDLQTTTQKLKTLQWQKDKGQNDKQRSTNHYTKN
jgi:hypothetical protein